MLQRLLSILFLLPAATTAVSAKHKPADLTGSWKETHRFTTDKKSIQYKDTLRIDFTIGNEYLWQKSGSFMYKGTYKATQDVLDLGARMFTILQMTPGQIVIKDDAGIYELTKYTRPALEQDNSKASSTARSNNSIENTINKDALPGKWEVYKRTSNTQLKDVDHTNIIRTIDIKWRGDSMSGIVMPAQYNPETTGWHIERFAHNKIYCNHSRVLDVKRCADGELILQEGTITYFFKKFK